MRKGLILGFVGNNPKHARRLPDDAVGQLIRGNVPLGYRTVLTGIEGNFEMGCAAAALRLRGEGLKIKLHIAVTRGKYKTYLRYKRDNLRPSEAHRIIEQADNVEIIEGKTPLEAERLRDRHVVDKSDLLFYYSTQLRDDFRNKYISYYLERQHPRKNVCDLSDKSGRAFVAKEASLRYMRERDLVVMANSIDRIYLQDWLAPDTDQLKKYFRAPKETAVVLLRDTGVCDPKLLPLRVFFYALSNSVITNLALPEKCWRESREYFDTFQNILRIIRLTRAHNIEIPDFNIFDFTRYGEIMRRIFQYQELK
ncbi:hypothetical protein CE91St16_21990 [Alistipes finegoldii]|uniref:Uncharacterized protein n=1 Tax=Alistipes finegoldii TaxID=214856 RepID=A0AA37KW11_9BACT|nr:hypothetical protein [Alistipes finegoldii]BDF65792.1 hypothetical protein CE91St15_32780 [Alistipes finegoldii]GKI19291.1 hypothetical protein CE91St16_21990 [Alistipes finegoldii]